MSCTKRDASSTYDTLADPCISPLEKGITAAL